MDLRIDPKYIRYKFLSYTVTLLIALGLAWAAEIMFWPPFNEYQFSIELILSFIILEISLPTVYILHELSSKIPERRHDKEKSKWKESWNIIHEENVQKRARDMLLNVALLLLFYGLTIIVFDYETSKMIGKIFTEIVRGAGFALVLYITLL